MGGRSRVGQIDYFDQARAIWASRARLLRPDATVVQLVSFVEPDLQLPAYLEMMSNAGFDLSPGFEATWREVPNRRWYYRVRPERERSREVLLVHRPRASTP